VIAEPVLWALVGLALGLVVVRRRSAGVAVLAAQSLLLGVIAVDHAVTEHGSVPAAVAIETLKIYDEMDIGAHVREVGPYMQQRLRERFTDHPLVGEVRGVGLVGALELVEDKAARKNFAPARKVGPRLLKHAEEHGVILRAMINDAIGFSPPLVISKDEIDAMIDRTAAALDALAVQLRRENLTVV